MHGSVAEMVSVKEEAPEVMAQGALDMDVAAMALFNLGSKINLSSTSTIEEPLWVGTNGTTGLPGH